MSHPVFTFYRRFVDDIRAGRKTITIRDESEAQWVPGQHLALFTNPENEPFGLIEVESVTPITFDLLTEEHARQENMTLDELRAVIDTIYPHRPPLFVIHFHLI